MPEPHDPSKEALSRLDKDLDTFEAKRTAPASILGGAEGAASQGYRLLAGLLGGIFGGLGVGWALDHFLHTSPVCLIVGVLLGTAAAIYGSVRDAFRTSAAARAKFGIAPSVSDDQDDDSN